MCECVRGGERMLEWVELNLGQVTSSCGLWSISKCAQVPWPVRYALYATTVDGNLEQMGPFATVEQALAAAQRKSDSRAGIDPYRWRGEAPEPEEQP